MFGSTSSQINIPGHRVKSDLKRGPGTWKFNNTLLDDKNNVDLIRFLYPQILEKYKDVENKQLLWELIKMEIRSKTISYSKSKRCELRKREVAIQNEQEKSFNNFTEDLELSKLTNEEPELLEHICMSCHLKKLKMFYIRLRKIKHQGKTGLLKSFMKHFSIFCNKIYLTLTMIIFTKEAFQFPREEEFCNILNS